MSKSAQSGAGAKKAPTTERKAIQAKSETPKAKTTAELIQEQKDYFAHKNDILRKLRIFEQKGENLNEVLSNIEESEAMQQDVFSEDSSYKLQITSGYSNELCTIKTPVIIKSVIAAVLVEIEKNRKSLEVELLSK